MSEKNLQWFCSKCFNPFSTNFTKWSNTLKQFVSNLPTNCLSVFDHFMGLALKGLTEFLNYWFYPENKKENVALKLSREKLF